MPDCVRYVNSQPACAIVRGANAEHFALRLDQLSLESHHVASWLRVNAIT